MRIVNIFHGVFRVIFLTDPRHFSHRSASFFSQIRVIFLTFTSFFLLKLLSFSDPRKEKREKRKARARTHARARARARTHAHAHARTRTRTRTHARTHAHAHARTRTRETPRPAPDSGPWPLFSAAAAYGAASQNPITPPNSPQNAPNKPPSHFFQKRTENPRDRQINALKPNPAVLDPKEKNRPTDGRRDDPRRTTTARL